MLPPKPKNSPALPGGRPPGNENSAQSLSKILARISHDLRAPMRHTVQLSTFLMEDEALSDSAVADVQRIAREGTRAMDMLDGLLKLAEAQSASLTTREVDLSRLIHGCAERVRAAHPGRSLEVTIETAALVDADEEQLETLFFELLDNAVRHGVTDTSIVHIELSESPTPHLRLSDEGPGLRSPEALADALLPFVKHEHDRGQLQRLGLGLSIAAAIADRHSGALWLEDAPTAGLCACLALPGLREREPESLRLAPHSRRSSLPPEGTVDTHDGASLRPPGIPSLSSVPPASGGVRVLLVEDSEFDFHMVAHRLSAARADYRLDWVRTMEAGLQAIAQNRHHILLVDHYLGSGPGSGSGLELLRRAVSDGWFGTAVLLTGAQSEELALDAVRAGFSDYLCKSELTTSRLERTIHYCLERHRRSMELASAAYVDGLTQLLNLRGLEVSAHNVLQRAGRTGQALAVLVLDLDGFKGVNDTHGHGAGNVVLKQVANRLRARLRGSDLVARTGGDEFVVVLCDVADETAVRRIMGELCDAVETPIPLRDGSVQRVGCSMGHAMHGMGSDSLTSLMQRADAAMYAHKRERKQLEGRTASR